MKGKLYLKGFRGIVIKATRRSMGLSSPIRDFLVYARQLEEKGIKVLKLNIGDPNKFDFETPKHIREALCHAVEECDNGYADAEGLAELRRAIIEKEREKNHIDLDIGDVVITTGVTEAIQAVVAASIEPGDELLLPGPGYPTYSEYVSFFDGVPVPYKKDESNEWQPDLEDMRKKITKKTKGIVVINPNNPTGAVYSQKTLKAIADLAGEYGLFLITDEIYDLMTFDGTHHSPSTLAPDVPVIIFNGFSKVNLLPGWRLGYIAFRDAGGQLEEIKSGVMRQLRVRLSANHPCQIAMLQALKGPKDYMAETNRKLRERAIFAYKRFNEIEGLSTTKPRGAFYIFPKIESNKWKSDRDFILDVLLNAHILFAPGSGFCRTYGIGHFRSVFLPSIDILSEAFDRLEDFLRSR